LLKVVFSLLKDLKFKLSLLVKDVRGDKQLPKQYEADRALKNTATVSSWKQLRFYKQFPGYEVKVLYADGSVARGNTTLGRVRDSYMDDVD